MFRALLLAFAELFSRPIAGVLVTVALLSAGSFALLWLAISVALSEWLGDTWIATSLGGSATLVLAWFLLPTVTSSFVGLFLDRIARIVERRHYPTLPTAEGLPFGEALWASMRFFAVLLFANLLLLVLLLFPPVYAVMWVVVNGYLLGREYTELVLMRRLRRAAADGVRRRHRFEGMFAGAGLAVLAALPIVNLVLPVCATAFVVHRTHDWRAYS